MPHTSPPLIQVWPHTEAPNRERGLCPRAISWVALVHQSLAGTAIEQMLLERGTSQEPIQRRALPDGSVLLWPISRVPGQPTWTPDCFSVL
jgi:hypothetical protein